MSSRWGQIVEGLEIVNKLLIIQLEGGKNNVIDFQFGKKLKW